MTDQQIRAAILEAAYDAGGPVNVLRISEDWGVKKEKILAILNALRKEGLLKSRIIGLGRGRGMVETMWDEITAKGIDEYERTHGIDKEK